MLPQKRWLIGKRIVDVRWRPFDDGKGGVAYDPVFILEGGRRLAFVVQETEVGEYGIEPVYSAPAPAPAPAPGEVT